jgi:3-hydroxyacyl-CoA dehydrogenase
MTAAPTLGEDRIAKPVERVAVVGAGVIGSGWAARILGAGLDVAAWDPAPEAEGKALAAIDVAWRAMSRRGLAPGASPSRLTFHESAEDCVAGADFIQENAPGKSSNAWAPQWRRPPRRAPSSAS